MSARSPFMESTASSPSSAVLKAPGSPFLPTDFALQSTPAHVALIMDGNRRWARARGLPDSAGHREGAGALEALLPVVAATGVRTLTVFGFSSANWRRNEAEVSSLFNLAGRMLRRFAPRCVEEGLKVEVIGRRDRLPPGLVRAVENTERMTAGGMRRLRIALDYSARDAILTAARQMAYSDAADREDLCVFDRCLGSPGDVDLLVRTGCEQRLSDFLLWECAFAELYFPDLHWPDFSPAAFLEALAWYGRRQRRYGA